MLIVEQFNSLIDAPMRERAEQVARQSSIALVNALRYRALPTIPFIRRRTNVSGQPTAMVAKVMAVLAGVALLASLFFIQADFDVYADGELQPEQQQHVFAPFDGQVRADCRYRHGDRVAANDVLVELRSPELELESQRVQGEFDTTQKRLSSIESSLLEINAAKERDENRFNQLAAEQQELEQVRASQQEQLALLRRQRDQLVVHAPMAGTITTWDLEQLLLNRPVQRGQQMLNVADLDGPWIAELKVPDDHIGHVLDAKNRSQCDDGVVSIGHEPRCRLQGNGSPYREPHGSCRRQAVGRPGDARCGQKEHPRTSARRDDSRENLLRPKVAGVRVVPRRGRGRSELVPILICHYPYLLFYYVQFATTFQVPQLCDRYLSMRSLARSDFYCHGAGSIAQHRLRCGTARD